MNITAAAVTAVAFPLLLWAIGRAVTAAGARRPAKAGASRQYLAGRLYGLHITAVVACGDELLVRLSTPSGDEQPPGVFRVPADLYQRARIARWQREGTLLHGYLSADGAIMLADRVLGGNAACEPATATPTHGHLPPGSQNSGRRRA